MKITTKAVYLLALTLSLISCRTSPPIESRLEQLALAFHTLDCRQATLELQSRSSWDGVVEQLDARLPVDMPAAEKNNMLMVRNATLIRMFETYHGLPDSVQALVAHAEQKDQEIVALLSALETERSALNAQKRNLFLSIEKKLAGKLPALRQQFDSIRNTPCR